MSLPLPLALLIVGIALICIGYYVTAPPPLLRLATGIGVFLVIVAVVLLLWLLLGGSLSAHAAPLDLRAGPLALGLMAAGAPGPPATKVWWKSKTVWFNVLTAILSVAAALLTPGLVSDPHVLAELAAFIAAGNVLLRLFGTSTGLTLNSQPPEPPPTLGSAGLAALQFPPPPGVTLPRSPLLGGSGGAGVTNPQPPAPPA